MAKNDEMCGYLEHTREREREREREIQQKPVGLQSYV